MTPTTDGELRLSKGALLFVPDGAPDLLLRVEAPGFSPPAGMRAARARLVLRQRATDVGPAPRQAKAKLSPAHGVPEELVGDVVGAQGDGLVVDVGALRIVVDGAAPADAGDDRRVTATLAPPLFAGAVALL